MLVGQDLPPFPVNHGLGASREIAVHPERPGCDAEIGDVLESGDLHVPWRQTVVQRQRLCEHVVRELPAERNQPFGLHLPQGVVVEDVVELQDRVTGHEVGDHKVVVPVVDEVELLVVGGGHAEGVPRKQLPLPRGEVPELLAIGDIVQVGRHAVPGDLCCDRQGLIGRDLELGRRRPGQHHQDDPDSNCALHHLPSSLRPSADRQPPSRST